MGGLDAVGSVAKVEDLLVVGDLAPGLSVDDAVGAFESAVDGEGAVASVVQGVGPGQAAAVERVGCVYRGGQAVAVGWGDDLVVGPVAAGAWVSGGGLGAAALCSGPRCSRGRGRLRCGRLRLSTGTSVEELVHVDVLARERLVRFRVEDRYDGLDAEGSVEGMLRVDVGQLHGGFQRVR